MGVEKHKNQVYVIDLSLVTKRRIAQIKIIANCFLNSKLARTIRFVNVNNYLSINKYNILDSYDSKTNNFLNVAFV